MLKLLLRLKLQAANTEPGLQGGSSQSITRPPSSPLANSSHPIPVPQHPPAAELGRNHLILLLCRAIRLDTRSVDKHQPYLSLKVWQQAWRWAELLVSVSVSCETLWRSPTAALALPPPRFGSRCHAVGSPHRELNHPDSSLRLCFHTLTCSAPVQAGSPHLQHELVGGWAARPCHGSAWPLTYKLSKPTASAGMTVVLLRQHHPLAASSQARSPSRAAGCERSTSAKEEHPRSGVGLGPAESQGIPIL